MSHEMTRDHDRCVCCGECVYVCPQSGEGAQYPVIVDSHPGKEPPEVVNVENCIQCMQCVDTCRAMAISFSNFREVKQALTDPYLVREADKIL